MRDEDFVVSGQSWWETFIDDYHEHYNKMSMNYYEKTWKPRCEGSLI